MKRFDVPAPLLGFIAATRAALGAGIALLASRSLRRSSRRRVGLSLVAIGALTTIPAVMLLARSRRRELEEAPMGGA
jgi:hypothetical protein